MAEEPATPQSLFRALAGLGRSLADLAQAVRGEAPADMMPHEDEPPPQLNLPAPQQHMEGAQLLTQHTPGWHMPHPSHLAVPSYAPAMTAFGIVFIALGAVTMWPLSVIGAIIFVLAIAKWIGELLHD